MKEVVMGDSLNALEARHRHLDDTVTRLARRAFLTPTEQREVADLKKEKLLMRDRIEVLRRSEPPSAR